MVPGELQDLVAFNATISACEKALEGTPSLKIKMRSSGDPHLGIYSEKKPGIQSEILSSILSGMRFGPGKPREPASSPQGSSPQNPTELASSLSVSFCENLDALPGRWGNDARQFSCGTC